MSPLSVGLSSLNREGSYENARRKRSQRKTVAIEEGVNAADAVRCNPSRYLSPSTIRQVLPRRLLGSRTPTATSAEEPAPALPATSTEPH